MNLWNIKAHIYTLRTFPLFRRILEREKSNLRKLAQQMEPIQGMVLDIGSGTGQTRDILPERPIICLDSSLAMLKKLSKRGEGDIKLTAEACHLPFRDGSFSLVSCLGVSEYLSDLTLFYEEVNRILENDGYLLTTVSPPIIWNILRQIWGNRLYLVSGSDLQHIIREAGFEKKAELHSQIQKQYLFRKTISN